jgi:hypothetical protein
MRRLAAPLLAALLAASSPARAADPILPDPALTPGEVLTTDASTVCRSGYARSVRHTSGRLKARVYRNYGLDRRQGRYEVDHLISLELGGANATSNLWVEPGKIPNAKDAVENRLHKEVCTGQITLAEAQREIATNWTTAR